MFGRGGIDEAKVWTATSNDIQGLVIEAEALPEVFHEIALVLPDLLELQERSIMTADPIALTQELVRCPVGDAGRRRRAGVS